MMQVLKSTVVVSDFRRYKLCETVAWYSSSPKDSAATAAAAVAAVITLVQSINQVVSD
jgi:hypothetical protein